MKTLACAVLTLSDTRSPSEDHNGQLIQRLLLAAGHEIRAYHVLPDEPELLRAWLAQWQNQAHVLLLTGGTGLSPRDITPEVVEPLLTKSLPGFGELFRMLSWEQVGTKAMASRALGGLLGTTLVFVLPGSTKAVTLAMERLILPEMVHLVRLALGEGH